MKIYFVFLLTLCVFYLTRASVIKFEASPSFLKQNLTTFASMRCSLADTEISGGNNVIGRKRDVVTGSDARSRRDVTLNEETNTTDDILRVNSITVRRDDGTEVTFATPFDTPTAMVDQGNLAVKGDVTGRGSQAYVELSWTDASLVALGGYSCEIETVDKEHRHRMYTASLELTSVPPSLSDVIAFFKHESNEQNKEIENLKNLNGAQQQEINKLKQCNAARVGFTGTLKNTGTINIPQGQTVIFDNVIYNVGGAYDPSTGLFTCSKPGMYNFNIHTLAAGSNSPSVLELHLNGKPIVSATSVGISQGHRSSSNSAVLELKQGDEVKVVTAYLSIMNQPADSSTWGYQGNVFSGFLLQAEDCQA